MYNKRCVPTEYHLVERKKTYFGVIKESSKRLQNGKHVAL